MPPDWVSDKPHHARVQWSKVFSSVGDTKLGEMANMISKFIRGWNADSKATELDLIALSLGSKYHLINTGDGKKWFDYFV